MNRILVIGCLVACIAPAFSDDCLLTEIMGSWKGVVDTCAKEVAGSDSELTSRIKKGINSLTKMDTLFPMLSTDKVQLSDDDKNKVILTVLCSDKNITERLPSISVIIYDCIVQASVTDYSNIIKCLMQKFQANCGAKKRSVDSPSNELFKWFWPKWKFGLNN